MSAEIIDGAAVAASVRAAVGRRVDALRAATGHIAGLATVIVGDDPASLAYVGGKVRACGEIGMHSHYEHLPASTTQEELLAVIDRLDADPAIDGILVQIPLPAHIDTDAIIEHIPPAKDVDGFHPINVGRVAAGSPRSLPQCTPAGIMRLLDYHEVEVVSANVTIVGRSALVGRPLALMMMSRNATVTVTHSLTRDLPSFTRGAEILVVAAGAPGLIKPDMVLPGAVVIDVGITRTPDGLVGDVDFAGVSRVAGKITPVPGGVGPMTVAMLLDNTITAAERAHQIGAS